MRSTFNIDGFSRTRLSAASGSNRFDPFPVSEIQCISIMATTEMVHVRIDKRTKAKAAKALAAMGLSVSDAVRVLLTRVAAEKSLPFEVKAPNAATAAAMREARRGGLPSFRSVSDLMTDLNAED
jgi:DNA-damage-inducible protein J